MKEIFGNLSKLKEPIEVVVNDWGVLNLIYRDYKKLEPILGRLLNKMIRMPQFEKFWPKLSPKQMKILHSIFLQKENSKRYSTNLWLKLTSKQIKALQSCSVSLNSYRRYLLTLGIKRIEFDLVPQGIDLDLSCDKLKGSIYYPWSYITTGRICEIGSMHLPVKKKFTLYNFCFKECRNYYIMWKTDWPFISNEIFQKGNTVFIKSNTAIETLRYYFKKGFNRIIYEPTLPF